jgi:hypothetical protein
LFGGLIFRFIKMFIDLSFFIPKKPNSNKNLILMFCDLES